MSFKFEERPGSGASTKESLELLYVATGSDDKTYVRTRAISLTEPVVVLSAQEGFVYRQDVLIEPAGHKLFNVTVPYGKTKKENGSFSWTFDTMGGTVQMKASKETVNKYPEDAADMKQAMNVGKDGEVEGTTVSVPALKMTFTFRHPRGIITIPRVKELARKTAYVNNDTWNGFKPGEALFLGAKGSDGTDADAEVAYDVVFSENVTGQSIGDIADIEKAGHDYLWMTFKPAVDAGNACTQPLAVYVERVYERTSFRNLLGFGG